MRSPGRSGRPATWVPGGSDLRQECFGFRSDPPTGRQSDRARRVRPRGPRASFRARSRVPAPSPGSLAGNPPPRWGAPGDDRAARRPAVGKRGIPCGTTGPDEPESVMTAVLHAPASARSRHVVGADLEVPLVDGRASLRRPRRRGHRAALPPSPTPSTEVLPLYASVHRGAGCTSQVSTALLECARDRRAVRRRPRRRRRGLHPEHHRRAEPARHGVPRRWRVLFLDLEHHANLLPWQRSGHRCVDARDTVRATVDAAGRRTRASRPALLAVTGASNVTGELLPLARARGARPRARRPDRRRRRPARPAPAHRPRRDRRRLRRLLRAQALRARTGRACWSDAATGSTRRRRTWPAAAPSAGEVPATPRRPLGPRRSGTRPGRRTWSAPSRSPRPAGRSSPATPCSAHERALRPG